MGIKDDDDELTDITSLPNFNHDDEEDFESLDDLAAKIEDDEDSPPDFPTPPEFEGEESEFDSDMDFSDSTSSFDFSDNEETDFSNHDDEEIKDEEEPEFESHDFSSESEFESDADFESHDFADESEDETDFNSENDIEAQESDFTVSDFSDSEENEQSSSEISNDMASAKPESIERAYEKIEAKRYGEETSSKLTSTEDLNEIKEIEHQKIKTLIEEDEKTHQTPPEDFKDFKNFAKSMTFSDFSSEGNPPFSIIVKNLKYKEDALEIIDILSQYKIIKSEDKEQAQSSILRGQFLIPRLSEYAAIVICHKLRSFDCELLMGLTEEISPPRSYESQDRGLSSKRTIRSNQKHNFHMGRTPLAQDILTTTLDKLQDFQIVKYLGVATHAHNVDYQKFHETAHLENEIMNQIDENKKEEVESFMLRAENISASQSQNYFSYKDFYQNNKNADSKPADLNSIYSELIKKLRAQAKDAGANAIVGINFAITPITLEEYLSSGPQYQITCTGNMVWAERL